MQKSSPPLPNGIEAGCEKFSAQNFSSFSFSFNQERGGKPILKSPDEYFKLRSKPSQEKKFI